jgi:hypothetical protein
MLIILPGPRKPGLATMPPDIWRPGCLGCCTSWLSSEPAAAAAAAAATPPNNDQAAGEEWSQWHVGLQSRPVSQHCLHSQSAEVATVLHAVVLC